MYTAYRHRSSDSTVCGGDAKVFNGRCYALYTDVLTYYRVHSLHFDQQDYSATLIRLS